MKVGIIGGGIIGLTTGVVLAEAGHEVHIYSRDAFNRTTSFAAGAVVYPVTVEDSPRAARWFLETVEILKGLLSNPAAGVFRVDWREYTQRPTYEIPSWLNALEGTRLLASHECPLSYQSGVAARLLFMNIDFYAPYLMKRFEAAGGIYEIKEIENAEALSCFYDALVNATGVYARHFVGDKQIMPIRGQVVIVKNPGIEAYLATLDTKNYLFSRGAYCVLGGSFDQDDWSMAPDPNLTKNILNWAASINPEFENAEIIDVRVGLRPFRPTIRLEKEILPDGTPFIHNYGHGGAGYTLSWACAHDVLKLVKGEPVNHG